MRANAWPLAALPLLGSWFGCLLPTTVWIPTAPLEPEARAVVMFFQTDELVFAHATSLEPGGHAANNSQFPARRWKGGAPSPFRVTAAYYSATLLELGLSSGEVGAGPVDGRSCALGEPLATYSTRVDDGDAKEWTKGSTLLAANELRWLIPDTASCRAVPRCLQLEGRSFDLDTPSNVQVILPIDEETALVANIHDRFWRVSIDGIERFTALDGLPSVAGVRFEDGTFAFGGSGARFAVGPLDGPFEQEVVGDPNLTIGAFGGPLDDLFALAADTSTTIHQIALLHRGPQEWTELLRIPIRKAATAQFRIAYLGPGELVAVYAGENLLHLVNGVPRFLQVDVAVPIFDLELSALTVHPTVGVVVGSSDGRLYSAQRPFTDWRGLGGALGTSVEVLERYGDGLVFGGADGVIAQFYFPSEACDSEALVRSDAEAILAFGERLLVSGGNARQEQPNSVTWLWPAR